LGKFCKTFLSQGARGIRVELFRILVFMCMAAVLSACIPLSDKPITKPNQHAVKDLLGKWKVVIEIDGESACPEAGSDVIVKDAGQGYLAINVVKPDKETVSYKAHVSTLSLVVKQPEKTYAPHKLQAIESDKGRNYLNILPAGENNKYILAKYRLADGVILFQTLNIESTQKDIKNKTVKGRIKDDGMLEETTITDSRSKLQYYIYFNARFNAGCILKKK
jgi:hypothetical protein